MVETDWLQNYEPLGLLPRFSTVVQSWDTANKSGELNDFSVCTMWGVYDGRNYLLDILRERIDYPSLKRKVTEQIRKFGPRIVLIEDKSSGTPLIQALKAGSQYWVKPYTPPPQTDKIMRFHAQTTKFEAGKVLLPTAAPWLAEYVRELTTFPGTKFGDQIDSTTQALDHPTSYRGAEIWAKLTR